MADLEEEIRQSLRNDRLSLTLFPTEKCNFRCSYCYEDFALGMMNERTVRGIKAFLSRRAPELRYLNVSWFGGEPLLAMRVISEISQHILDLLEINPSLIYSGSMTTNGYKLDASTARELFEFGVTSYQISLDGDEDEHNSTRKRADGHSTFDVIWNNLLDISKTDLSLDVLIRLHIHQENVASARVLCRKLRECFDRDTRFTVLIKAIGKYGGPNDELLPVLRGKRLAEVIASCKEALGERLHIQKLQEGICYAAKANAWAIRANGNLARCTVALNNERNSIGRILENGELEMNETKLAPWLSGLAKADASALSCPLHTVFAQALS
jgi:uncharacterized protein